MIDDIATTSEEDQQSIEIEVHLDALRLRTLDLEDDVLDLDTEEDNE